MVNCCVSLLTFFISSYYFSVDQSTTLDTTSMLPQSSLSGEEEWYPQKQEKKKRQEDKQQKPEAMHHANHHHGNREQYLRHPDQSVPDRDDTRNGDSSQASVDTLLSDMSLESDQLYRLLGAQGVRKLSSKLARLQSKIEKQKEHHRKREEQLAQKKRSGEPKMASTPASHQRVSVDNLLLQKVADVVKVKGDVSGHTLSPVAERSHEMLEMPSQITNQSALSDRHQGQRHPSATRHGGEKTVKHHSRLSDHQIKKMERRRKHRHVNYRDDFHVTYGSDSLTDSVSDGSVPCTCRPRRTRSLQDIAAKARSKATVTIEPKSHIIRKGTFKKPSVPTRGSRLPSRIPVQGAEDPTSQKSPEPRRATKGTAFMITFPSDKGKGKKDENKPTDEENRSKPKRHLQYRHRETGDG